MADVIIKIRTYSHVMPVSSPSHCLPSGPETLKTAAPAVAVSATFTAEVIEESLRFWLRELGLEYQIRFAAYNQVFQQLLDPASLLATNRNGVDLVLVRLEDWARAGDSATAVANLDANVRHFIACLQTAAAAFSSPLVVCVCPDSPTYLELPDYAAAVERMHGLLTEAAAVLSAVHLTLPQDIERLYPVADYYDPHGDDLGHVPYRPAFFAALGTMAARRIRALKSAPYKVIVLDCDETLWSGICGEDGPEGILIDPPRRALQEFMVDQHHAGVLLCLASKNNEEDVLETFRLNPQMPLRLEHFAARRINWESKSSNLVSLADELGLGLDSFILVDDNAKECAEVEANCPEVVTLLLPGEVEQIPRFLAHVWAFDHLKRTAEDAARTALYTQRAERYRLEKQAASLEEFLESLKLEVRMAPPAPAELARVSQLTLRTNQMNFTTVRRGEAEIRQLLDGSGAECLVVKVTDRFGNYGLVGVMIFIARGAALELDTFLLSCRALGRGVEHRMLARLGEIAAERGLDRVDVAFRPTQKNRPALEFLRSAGPQFETGAPPGLLFRFPAGYLTTVAYKPGSGRPSAPAAKPLAATPKPSADYGFMARELREPAQILAAVTAARKPQPASNGGNARPRTELERELAAIWARLLHLAEVGIHDSFFDLGGHSLLAVQLLSEVRQRFQVDISLQIVYAGAFTVAELAKAVELYQIEQAGTGEYAELLAELDGLSDEEARDLLAREQDGTA